MREIGGYDLSYCSLAGSQLERLRQIETLVNITVAIQFQKVVLGMTCVMTSSEIKRN